MFSSRLLCHKIYRNTYIYCSLRCASNSPKTTPDQVSKIDNVTQPLIRRDPVPQKLLNPIKVEYHAVKSVNFNDDTIWLPIFRFPYITWCKTFIRLKVYITFTSLALSTLKLYQFLMMPEGTLTMVGLLSTFTLGFMVFAGNLFRKFVCQVYLSEDSQFVRFSRFTFFGKRRDIVLPVSSIVPLSETNYSARKSFLLLKTIRPEIVDLEYDRLEFYDEKFYLTLVFGGVLDKEKFSVALGRIQYVKE